MAGDWIKWTKGLAKRPEVLQMAADLGRSRHEVAGLVMEFWEWCDDNVVPEGETANCSGLVSIAAVSTTLVDSIVGVPGFADSMTAVDWLRINAARGLLELPRFARHNGKTAKRRVQDAERKFEARASDSIAPEPTVCAEDDVRKMSASEADILRTREEKRREEENKGVPLFSKTETPNPSTSSSRKTDRATPLYRALIRLTGSRACAKADAVAALLLDAKPPYSAAELEKLPVVLAEQWPGLEVALSLEVVEKRFTWIRTPPVKSGGAAKGLSEKQKARLAALDAKPVGKKDNAK